MLGEMNFTAAFRASVNELHGAVSAAEGGCRACLPDGMDLYPSCDGSLIPCVNQPDTLGLATTVLDSYNTFKMSALPLR